MSTAARGRRAVVTGAAGFIGSHLSERLVAEGWRVVGVDAFTDYYARPDKEANLSRLAREPQFDLVEANLVGDAWRAVLRPGDTVFHLAAQPGVRGSFGATFARYALDNVVATQRVLEAALQTGCRRVVWASSSSVYGDASDYPCPESATAQPVSPYGVTKHACEDLAAVYARLGLSVVGLRYFTVYGPRQRPDMAFRRLCEAVVNGDTFPVFGDGGQSRDFTFVSDACEATLRAGLVRDPLPVYNIGGGTEASLLQIIELVEYLAKTPLARVRRTPQAGDVRRTKADTAAARRDLGWEPTVDLEAGLAAQLTWVREESACRQPA